MKGRAREPDKQGEDARRHAVTRVRVAGAVLLTFALLTMGTGVYFMALRPPLLPEDLRFTGLEQADVPARLRPWLAVVFRTWGGFVVGLGLCIAGHGAASWMNQPAWSRVSAALGVLFAFGSFLASNIQLRSEFLWFIGLLFVGAVACAVVLIGQRRNAGDSDA
jgi:hypothetical protein